MLRYLGIVLFLLLPTVSRAAGVEPILPKDLSPWGMFLNADWVVKAVMIGLLIASVMTWSVWLVKTLEVWRIKRQLKETAESCHDAASLESAIQHTAPELGQAFLSQARTELEFSAGLQSLAGIKERTESRLAEQESRMGQAMTHSTGVLATIGATAPFVGLFGTVWGIMNSFIGISQANTTNLAVVAPGIAEALLATAFGLVAAIPAVILYNLLARQIGRNKALLRELSMQVMRVVSRDLDKGNRPREVRNGDAAA